MSKNNNNKRIITLFPDEYKNNIHSLIIFLEQMNYKTKTKFEIIDILKTMKTQTIESKEKDQIDKYIHNINDIYTYFYNLDKKKVYYSLSLYYVLTNYKKNYIPMKEQPWIYNYKNLNKAGSLKKLATKVKLTAKSATPAKSSAQTVKSSTKLAAGVKSAPAKSAPAKSAPAKSAPAKAAAIPNNSSLICKLINDYDKMIKK